MIARSVLVLAACLHQAAAADRFTEWLRAEAGDQWDRVVNHEFTDRLAAGTLDHAVLGRYLVQDHRFLDSFAVLLASAIAAAPTLADRVPGAQFLALILGKENTYFERSFDALGISAADREQTPDAPVTAHFTGLMRTAAASGRLEVMLAVLVVAEWSYLSWATRVSPAPSLPFYCLEWLDLHRGPYFTSVVGYLRELLDRVGEGLGQEEREQVRRYFVRAVDLEEAFFEMAIGREVPLHDEL